MQRLKILFLPAWYPREDKPVAGIFVKEHAKAVSLYNDVAVIYACPDLQSPGRKLYEVSEAMEEGIRTIRIRYRRSPIPKTNFFVLRLVRLWSLFACFRKLVKDGWKPDIIHVHIYEAGMPAVILGKLYGIPVVITEHWHGFPLHILGPLDRARARFSMNRAKRILPVSDNLRVHIQAYGIKNKFQVIPNAVNTGMFYPLPDENKGGDEKRKILLVALLTPVKGVPYLLQALTEIREKRQDFVLDIVGDGPNKEEYEELAVKLGLSQIVNFQGLKPKEEVAEFMRKCSFLVLPSWWENLPVVCIEAMACGKSVLATDVGGVREIVREDTGIVVPPKEVESLTKAIEFMLDNYAIYPSEKIAQYAKENFSFEVVGHRLDEVYREVLAEA